MSRRPKDIGTEGETATVRYAIANGFKKAKRIAPNGRYDLGDVSLGDGVAVAVEVKWGKQTDPCGPGAITEWMAETEVERVNAGKDVGVLIIKRKGVGKDRLGECWAYMTADTVAYLCDSARHVMGEAPAFPVRMFAAEAFQLLRWAGYGDPLPVAVVAA